MNAALLLATISLHGFLDGYYAWNGNQPVLRLNLDVMEIAVSVAAAIRITSLDDERVIACRAARCAGRWGGPSPSSSCIWIRRSMWWLSVQNNEV